MRCLNDIAHALSQHIDIKAFSLFLLILKSGKFQISPKGKRRTFTSDRGLSLFGDIGFPEPQNQIIEVHDFFYALIRTYKNDPKRTKKGPNVLKESNVILQAK